MQHGRCSEKRPGSERRSFGTLWPTWRRCTDVVVWCQGNTGEMLGRLKMKTIRPFEPADEADEVRCVWVVSATDLKGGNRELSRVGVAEGSNVNQDARKPVAGADPADPAPCGDSISDRKPLSRGRKRAETVGWPKVPPGYEIQWRDLGHQSRTQMTRDCTGEQCAPCCTIWRWKVEEESKQGRKPRSSEDGRQSARETPNLRHGVPWYAVAVPCPRSSSTLGPRSRHSRRRSWPRKR